MYFIIVNDIFNAIFSYMFTCLLQLYLFMSCWYYAHLRDNIIIIFYSFYVETSMFSLFYQINEYNNNI